MTKEKDSTKSSPGIFIAIIIISFGGVLLYFNQAFWGWAMLAVGAYGLVQSLLEPRIGKDKATNIAAVVAMFMVVTVLILLVFLKVQIEWLRAVVGMIIAALVAVSLQGIFSLIQTAKWRVALKSLSVMAFAGALLILYHIYMQQIFLLNAVVLFLVASNLRQALNELLLVQADKFVDSGAFILPDALVLVASVLGLVYYQDLLFFHLFVVILVMSVFRFATEKYISEVAVREREKIDIVSGKQKSGYSFFIALTGTHSSSNLVMLPALLIFELLSIEKYVTILDIQGDVFQASITLLGIVIGFSTLILGERLNRSADGWKKQTYLLRGLVGITLLFFVVAGVSFLARVLQPIVVQLGLPTPNQIIDGFLIDDNIRIRVVAALANEFILFSIPAALLYLFSLSRDLMERYERVQE